MPATATKISDPCRGWLSRNTMTYDEVKGDFDECFRRARDAHSPVVITRNGQATSLLIDLKDLNAFLEAEQLREDVRVSLKQIEKGQTFSNEEVFREMDAMLHSRGFRP